MARKLSAGILVYRIRSGTPEVLLVHPGGPFWAKKDSGAWSIPKGEFDEGADPLETAKREFLEETGSPVRASTDSSVSCYHRRGAKDAKESKTKKGRCEFVRSHGCICSSMARNVSNQSNSIFSLQSSLCASVPCGEN